MRCYTLKQAASETGIAYKVLLAAARAGELKAFVPPGMKRKQYVRDAELDRWVRSLETEGEEAPRTA